MFAFENPTTNEQAETSLKTNCCSGKLSSPDVNARIWVECAFSEYSNPFLLGLGRK